MSETPDQGPSPEEVAAFKRKLDSLTDHIEGVQRAAEKLASRLAEQGEFTLARRLVQRAYCHDNSKFEGIEWEWLDEPKGEKLATAIHQHQQGNNHHPEYFPKGIVEMTEVQVAEMVCDWHARQSEIGTDLRAWATGDAAKRYGYTTRSKVYRRIKRYIDLLLDAPLS